MTLLDFSCRNGYRTIFKYAQLIPDLQRKRKMLKRRILVGVHNENPSLSLGKVLAAPMR